MACVSICARAMFYKCKHPLERICTIMFVYLFQTLVLPTLSPRPMSDRRSVDNKIYQIKDENSVQNHRSSYCKRMPF